VRFTANNPGVTMVHCHILPHMVMGMQSVFVMGGEDLPALPAPYTNLYLEGGNFPPWNASEIDIIEHLKTSSSWDIS
jgi:L-ascorbate oxidase